MKKKFKLRYRILILAAVFFGALYYFSGNYLTVRSFDISRDTTEMSEASLPSISLLTGEEEINRLYGYTSNLDWTLIRETITPLDKEKTFTIKIDENRMTVRKLKYELFDVTDQSLLDSGTISALTTEEELGCKLAKIKLKAELEEGVEYSIKVTLITSTSKRIYYYTRVKMYLDGNLTEKLAYVRWFRDSAINKKNQMAVEQNLETKANADTTSFARVTIDSNWTMVSWGDMQPVILDELPPTVTDFYDGTAAVVLSYLVSVATDTGVESFMVRESFRFLYTDIRTYLYNYERETEAIYDVSLTSLSKNDLKLGITKDTGMEIFTSEQNKYTAFVRNRELWSYDRAENTMIQVFSFRSSSETDLYELYDAHAVKILDLDNSGNIDFLVYGYMNRGEYEGRVGIILYRYFQSDGRIEEQAYFPINTTYQLLKGELDEFVYLNRFDVLYLTIYDSVFTYNLTTRTLTRMAEEVPPEHITFMREQSQVIWQDEPEDAASQQLMVMNLETGQQKPIPAPEGEVINLLGAIDTNLVYGYARKADIVKDYDGTQIVPMYRLVIADLEGTVLKEYQSEGLYVTSASFDNGVIQLERVKRKDGEIPSYERTTPDAIQNRTVQESPSVSITGRVTKLTKTEYYITFPGDVEMKTIPAIKTVPFTVLTIDKTVRVNAMETRKEQYRTYSFGRVVIRTRNAAEAIRLANEDENVGAVIDSEGRVIWERGVKSARRTLSGISVKPDEKLNNIQLIMKALFAYKGFDVDTSGIRLDDKAFGNWLEEYLKVTAIRLKGTSLDEALYYVYKARPVVVFTGDNSAVLICGYDSTSLEVLDTVSGLTKKINREVAEEQFSDYGNLYYGYID